MPAKNPASEPAAIAADQKILELARVRFRLSADTENELRMKMRDDLRFYDGEQWDEAIRTQRDLDNRPCLTFPVIKQFVHQVTNEMRRNKPAPVVHPVDDKADPDTAETIMGLLRRINRQSNGDAARAYAGFYASVCGRGWYRITTDHEWDTIPEDAGVEVFDQDIYVRRIKHQASVYPDPMSSEPDYSDMKFCFVVEDILTSDFKAEHPNAQLVSADEFSSLGDFRQDWCPEADTIRVAEYFYVETTPVKVALVHDGFETATVMPLDEFEAFAVYTPGAQIIKTRTINVRKVCWVKMSGVEILEKRVWPGRWIPIIPVLGEEIVVDGKTNLTGMVRDAKHAQMQYNYMRTMQTEAIALAPRSPYIAEESQLEGHETEWAESNVRNFAVLKYKARAAGDHLVPAPQRQPFEPAIQAITLAVREAYEDLKRAIGLHDASLGARSNETSGVAIRQRQMEGDTANFHLQDNLGIAVTHECRMEVDLIPHIYDRPGRVARITGEEGDDKTVTLNAPFEEQGQQKIYDVRVGRYDVAVSFGPSVSTQRQAEGEMLMELTRAYPALMQVAGDVVISSLDIKGARKISERLRKMLPEQLQEGDDKQAPIPPQAKAQIMQLSQLVEQLTGELEEAADTINGKKLELDSKERIEAMKVRTDLIKTEAQLMSAEGIEVLRQEIAVLKSKLDRQMAEVPEQISPEQPGAMPLAA